MNDKRLNLLGKLSFIQINTATIVHLLQKAVWFDSTLMGERSLT